MGHAAHMWEKTNADSILMGKGEGNRHFQLYAWMG